MAELILFIMVELTLFIVAGSLLVFRKFSRITPAIDINISLKLPDFALKLLAVCWLLKLAELLKLPRFDIGIIELLFVFAEDALAPMPPRVVTGEAFGVILLGEGVDMLVVVLLLLLGVVVVIGLFVVVVVFDCG